MTPHKHAEVIKAWADGASIELKNIPSGKWEVVASPSFLDNVDYRVKPNPVMAWYRVAETDNGNPWLIHSSADSRSELFIEGHPAFIRWLTDRIEYEVTE